MTNSWLLVAEAASLRLLSDGLFLHVVELAATYLVQSTLFLAGGWALLPVLSSIHRRKKTNRDGQECPSYSPVLTERLWKLAAVLALVTAPLSVFTGWSRPAWEWSLREQPSPVNAVVSLETTHPEPAAMSEPFSLTVVESRPALPAELAVLDDNAPTEMLIVDEPSADFSSFSSTFTAQDDNLDHRIETEQIGIEPPTLPLTVLESPANSLSIRRDSDPVSASHIPTKLEPLQPSIHWLGIMLVAWVVLSASRLAVKGLALNRRLAGCEAIQDKLRHDLNRLLPRGRSVRLLRSGTLAPSFVGERARVRLPTGEDSVKMADDSAVTAFGKLPHESVTKTEEPLTLALSPQSRGEGTGEEPFACGLLRWTIVLPAGIERELSPAELKALLAHEVAHLVRRDPWWLWLGEVLCTCLAFQPLNFLARRRWLQAAELLCDDWAVERQVSATSLASCLTRIAEGRLDRQAALMGLSAVGHTGLLTQRIEWLLRTGRATEPKRPRGRTLATLLTFAAGLFVGTYGPRLSFVVPVEAGDDLKSIVVSSESELWNDIRFDLAETLNELARINSQLASDPDFEVASLAYQLRARAASLNEQLAQPIVPTSDAFTTRNSVQHGNE